MNSQPEAPLGVEKPILSLRRQGSVLTLPVLLLLTLAGASGYFVGALPESWMNWSAGLGALALALLFGVGPIMGWLTNRVVVTSRRVIVRRGFFVHHRSEIPLSRVREVRSRRGPGQRLVGSGNIELLVGSDAPTVLRDVPGPAAVVDALQELIEQNYLRHAQSQAQSQLQGWAGAPGQGAMPWPGQGLPGQPMPGGQLPGGRGASGLDETTVLP